MQSVSWPKNTTILYWEHHWVIYAKHTGKILSGQSLLSTVEQDVWLTLSVEMLTFFCILVLHINTVFIYSILFYFLEIFDSLWNTSIFVLFIPCGVVYRIHDTLKIAISKVENHRARTIFKIYIFEVSVRISVLMDPVSVVGLWRYLFMAELH